MTRILIVEDNRNLATGLRNNLEIEGYEVHVAADGTSGLALARSVAPDLIVLDLMMPGMSGWSFHRAQLADLNLAGIPVVILSATYEAGLVNDEPPVAAVMAKPYNLDALLTLVARLLRPAESFV